MFKKMEILELDLDIQRSEQSLEGTRIRSTSVGKHILKVPQSPKKIPR